MNESSSSYKDFLTRYFEQLGKVLAALLQMKQEQQWALAMEFVDESTKELLNLDLESLLKIPEEDYAELLVQAYAFNKEQLKAAGDLLFEAGDVKSQSEQPKEAGQYLIRAAQVYKHLQKVDNTFSWERMTKLERIEVLLGN